MAEVVRNEKGQFVPGSNGIGGRRKGSKHRITTRMLEKYEALEIEGKIITPFDFWIDLLNDKIDLSDMPAKEAMTLRNKAAENIAKYVYDHSLGNEDTEAVAQLSPDQIQALKSAFPVFK